MDKKKLLIRLTSLIVFISVLNFFAHKFYWYFSIWWSDMPMHFLGGLWLGLVFFYLFLPENLSLKLIFKVSLFILIIGIGWEIFEILFINYINQNPFNILDTISDLFFDLTGGLFAILYFYKKIMFIIKNAI